MIKLPSELELKSIHETWKINYIYSKQNRFTTKKIAPYELDIKGLTNNHRKCLETLEQWLKRKANRHLGAWLKAISEDTELHFHDYVIRGQKTLWGSCTEDKIINLNFKLLFLPAPLVDHIILHELCHTKEMNHSQNFYQLLSNFDSSYRQHNKILKTAYKFLPNCFS